MDRKLKDRIFLQLDKRWPSTALEEGESLLDASKRVLESIAGKNKQLDIYAASEAPLAVHMTKHGDNDKLFGTKTFYMLVQHDEGDIEKSGIEWLDRNEIVSQQADENDAKFARYLL